MDRPNIQTRGGLIQGTTKAGGQTSDNWHTNKLQAEQTATLQMGTMQHGGAISSRGGVERPSGFMETVRHMGMRRDSLSHPRSPWWENPDYYPEPLQLPPYVQPGRRQDYMGQDHLQQDQKMALDNRRKGPDGSEYIIYNNGNETGYTWLQSEYSMLRHDDPLKDNEQPYKNTRWEECLRPWEKVIRKEKIYQRNKAVHECRDVLKGKGHNIIGGQWRTASPEGVLKPRKQRLPDYSANVPCAPTVTGPSSEKASQPQRTAGESTAI